MIEVYITGVAGFIGQQVATLFQNSGYSVGGCDDFSVSEGAKNRVFTKSLDLFEREDVLKVRSLPPSTKYLIHAAGIMNSEDESEIYDVNAAGTANIMGIAREQGIKNIVNISNYQAASPFNAYSHSKYIAEGVANLANAISLRFSNLYGPDQRVGVLADWQRDYAEKRLVEVHGTGEQRRDFLHISDAAYAVYLAAHYGHWLQGRATDACTGQGTSIRDLVTLCGFPHTYTQERDGEFGFIQQHSDELWRTVGWTPRVGLGEGLKKMGLVERHPIVHALSQA